MERASGRDSCLFSLDAGHPPECTHLTRLAFERLIVISYRNLATRAVFCWALVSISSKLPVAMAPLALVFFVRERPAGYALGGALAAAYVVGEVLGAGFLIGPR